MACCLGTAPIELVEGHPPKLLGTLIIGFERRSEVLIHHLVRKEPTAIDVLFVAEKLAQKAISRLGKGPFCDAWRNLVLPWPGREREWSRRLYWLFEKNLPVSQRALAEDATDSRPRVPDGGELDLDHNLLRCRVQGRRFETRYDLWSPMYYGVGYPFPTIECIEKDGVNQVHNLLAEAAIATRAALRKLTPTLAADALLPTWEVQSRARRKGAA